MANGRAVHAADIYRRAKEAVLGMNVVLPEDVHARLREAHELENGPGKEVLARILENVDVAASQRIPMCQDTGMVIAFVEVGHEVRIEGSVRQALSRAVAEAYDEGAFRKSVVRDPLDRVNSGDNLPPVVYLEEVEGSTVRVGLIAKGFGSENCSRTYMLKPTDDEERIGEVVCETVRLAGGSPCPPVILGVGIGGTMDYAAVLSKKALLCPLGAKKDEATDRLEAALLSRVNGLGIGPGGLGGQTTALGVSVLRYPTHIAGLPVAVSVNCWADRRATVEI